MPRVKHLMAVDADSFDVELLITQVFLKTPSTPEFSCNCNVFLCDWHVYSNDIDVILRV